MTTQSRRSGSAMVDSLLNVTAWVQSASTPPWRELALDALTQRRRRDISIHALVPDEQGGQHHDHGLLGGGAVRLDALPGLGRVQTVAERGSVQADLGRQRFTGLAAVILRAEERLHQGGPLPHRL